MKRTFKANPLLSPVPAVMVSLGKGKEENIITIDWTGIINSNPPMTYISVRKERHSHSILMKEMEFVINLTTEGLAKAADFCGVKSGRDVDKFQVMGFSKEYGEHVKCPMISDSPVNLECKVLEVLEFPSHDMFIAEIVSVHVDEDIIDENGRICLERAKLISYIHGEYFPHKSRPLGKFGYSIMKPKTKRRINREKHSHRRYPHKYRKDSKRL